MLKSLRRVFIQFSPLDPRATAARELLQRVGNSESRKSNPDCVVDYKVEEGSNPSRSFVELQFTDNETHKLYTADLKLQDILKLIQQKTTEMEARSIFKEVNFDPAAAAASMSKARAGSSSSSTAGRGKSWHEH